MSSFPSWLLAAYQMIEDVVRRSCHDDVMADDVEEELKERLIEMAAEERLPESRPAGLALLKSILDHALVDCLRRPHAVPMDLAEEAVDKHSAREPSDGEPRAWEICEADLFPWARERSDALASELTPGMLRMLALPDGLSDEAAAATLAVPLKQFRRDKCRLLLRLGQARHRLEGDATQARPATRRPATKRGGRARRRH
jgi:hypothetical protein